MYFQGIIHQTCKFKFPCKIPVEEAFNNNSMWFFPRRTKACI